MPPVRTGAPTGAATAVQTAFRDVTNSYLSANKENIPPGFTGGGGGGGHPCGTSPNSTRKSRGPVPRDSAYCGTPVQGELRATSEAATTREARLGYTPSRGGAAQNAEGATVAATAAATRVAQLPLTPQGHRSLARHNGASAVADLSLASASDDSELAGGGGVARTPGLHRSHYAPAAAAASTVLGSVSTNPNGSNTSVACRLMQQQQRQQRGASQPQNPDSATLLAAATPNQSRQRPSRVARAALLSSPLYTPSGGPGFASSARLGCAAEGNNGTGAPLLTSQPSPMCTPKGARRSAALAAAAAAAAASGGGARPPYETPTRLEELSLFFNNSFESGSESPCGDAGAGMAAALSGYAAGMEAVSSSSAAAAAGAELTPTHTYDIQAAVEEMLRGCLDGSSPGKVSDASGTTPLGARRRQWQQQRQLQQQQHGTAPASPFNVNAALEALLPTATMPSGVEFDVWAPMAEAVAGAPGCTPERLTAPQGAFAESDEDEAMTTPQSDRASRGAPAAGVRRDPLVYFSTAAMPAVGDGSVRQVGADAEASPRAGSTATAESLSRHSSDVRSGFEYHCREGSGSGPDVLAMLAAAVQQHQQSRQQQQPSPPHGLDTQPQSARSTLGSAEVDVHHHAELTRELISSQSATAVPPSYGAPARGSAAATAHHVTADPAQPPSSAALPAAAAAAARMPAPRRSHHLPQVKAAAGSLIAVGGRRVPVNKLHLLAIGDEPAAGTAASSSPSAAAGEAKATSAAARGTATSSQAAAAHHVEGPSMRRMPKPSLVTVTRTPSCGNDERVSVVSGTRSRTISSPVPGPAGQPAQTSSARPARVPASASHTSLADDAPRPVSSAVPGPSARRVPPALAAQHLQQRHCGSVGAAVTTMSSSSPAAGGSGAQQQQQQHSSEADVVAVLQFSKGQRMRFLTNLSPAALAAAKGLVAREGGSGGAKRASSSAGGGITTSALSSRTLPTRVEVGKSYLAHVYASESPYDGVAYEDVGVCVELVVPSMTSPSAYTAHLSRVDGLLLRLVDVFGNDEDRRQHERALMQQTTAYIECERQFKFSSLPFQLESIYCTFDGSVCVVLYSVVGGTDRAAAASHRHPNTSRVVRELQFHLDCRVFLKRC